MAVTRLRDLERRIRRSPKTAVEIQKEKEYEKRQAKAFDTQNLGKRGYIK